MDRRWIWIAGAVLAASGLLGVVAHVRAVRAAEITTRPSDAIEYDGQYYKFYPGPVTFEEARTRCAKASGYLVSITSGAENAFVQALVDGEKVWIGLHDMGTDGDWTWVDGSTYSYENWREDPTGENTTTNEPNGGARENAVAMNWWADGTWNDHNERALLGYVCEWDD